MWHGLYVAKGTPKETVDALNAALRKAVSDPVVVAKLKDLGTVPFPDAEMSPEAHAKLFAGGRPRAVRPGGVRGRRQGEAKWRGAAPPPPPPATDPAAEEAAVLLRPRLV